jgi:hypothetical protein
VLDWAFIPVSTRAMLYAMRHAPFLGLGIWVMLAAGPVWAGPTVEEGPLTPCAQSQGEGSPDASAPPAHAWGVELATSFSKQEALDQFARIKQDYADLLGSYDPMVVESCDLHMGTDLQYSVRIGMDSRDDADNLCTKLRAAGGACIVQKN